MAITYDAANVILNAARQRVGDKMATLLASRGNFMDRTQADTQQAFNSAYRKLQEILAAIGYPQLTSEDILAAIPATSNLDPAYQLSLDIDSDPALPSTLIQPMECWERQTAAAGTQPTSFNEMTKVYNGLPAVLKLPFNENWEWRNDTLNLPGATAAFDLRVRYMAYLPDLADVTGATPAPWYTQTVLIARCLDPLADLICAAFIGKDDADGAAVFLARAQEGARLIGERDTLQEHAPTKGADLGRMGAIVPPGRSFAEATE